MAHADLTLAFSPGLEEGRSMNYPKKEQDVAGQIVFYNTAPVAFSGLRIGNFKPFGPSQAMALRPLTLILGENSAGKSSIIQSLLYAKNAFQTNSLDATETDPIAGGVDLGGFGQIVHRGESNRDISLGYSFPTPPSPENNRTRLEFADDCERPTVFQAYSPRLLGIDFTIGSDSPSRPNAPANRSEAIVVKEYTIRADGDVILKFTGGGGEATKTKSKTMAFSNSNLVDQLFMKLAYVNLEHPTIKGFIEADLQQIIGRGINPDYHLSPSETSRLGFFISSVGQSIIPSRRIREWDTSDCYNRLRFSPSSVVNPTAHDKKMNPLPQPETIVLGRLIDELVRAVHIQAADIMDRTNYLGPLRLLPDRDVGFPQRISGTWWSGGGSAWEMLRDDPRVQAKVNRWLSSKALLASPYSLVIQRFVEERNENKRQLNNRGADKRMGSGQSPGQERNSSMLEPQTFQRLRLLDKRNGTVVTHRDVGVGISQVLPVLVSAFGMRNQTHLIEQPEIHLHPRLQAELADVFIESALGENRNSFILETHSEHLLLRIMRRMRETATGKLPKGAMPISPKDVAVLYVERKGKRSIIREMPLNENGELLKAWPGGFFEEGLRELVG